MEEKKKSEVVSGSEREQSEFDKAVNSAVAELVQRLQEQIDSLKADVFVVSERLEKFGKVGADESANFGSEQSSKGGDCTLCLKGAVSGETGREIPDKRVDFSKLSYSELCAFLEKHPKSRLY